MSWTRVCLAVSAGLIIGAIWWRRRRGPLLAIVPDLPPAVDAGASDVIRRPDATQIMGGSGAERGGPRSQEDGT